MMTVHEVSKLTGVTIRTLQYYDRIGLLRPAEYSVAGYRLYGSAELERLQQILLFRELEFPLKEIRRILEIPDFDRELALTQQIELLTIKKERLENLISLATQLKAKGGNNMDFTAFDKSKLDEYAADAKAKWGHTDAYREYTEKAKVRSPEDDKGIAGSMMALFADFGKMRAMPEDCAEVQSKVKELRDFITEHFYHCTDDILSGLGKMYASGGEFTANIDSAGGEGTALFVSRAIEHFCRQ